MKMCRTSGGSPTRGVGGDLQLLAAAVADHDAHAGREPPDLVGVDAQLLLVTRGPDVGRQPALVLQAPFGGLGPAHAVEGLRGKDEGGAVAADDLDHPRGTFSVGDRGDLVDDEQDLAAIGVARRGTA
jgi:hypothetical protein